MQTHSALDNEVLITTQLIERLQNTFDEELYTLCRMYTRKHKELHEAIDKLHRTVKLYEREDQAKAVPLAQKISLIFDKPFQSQLGIIVFVITTIMIFLSVITLVLRSVPKFNPTVHPKYTDPWLWTEGSITIYFTVEWIVRFAVYADKITFIKQFTNITDFIALIPFYIELIADEDVGALRVLRLLRLMKFFRLFRSIEDLFVAVWESVSVLVAPIVFLTACLLVMSTILYYAERGHYDPDTMKFTMRDCYCEASPSFQFGDKLCSRVESKFYSILHTMWWGVVTMTTVGYGDLVPLCPFGKVVASVSMVLGVIFMAMPIAIVGSYFAVSVDNRKHREEVAMLEEARVMKQRVRGSAHESPEDKEMALVVENQTPAVAFISFLRTRLKERSLSLDNPSPYVLMLIDFYFGTKNYDVESVPTAVTYELAYISLDPRDTVATDLRRITLNRYVDMIIGATSSRRIPGYIQDIPEPDIAVPLDTLQAQTGIAYRISQRHAVLSIPPQYTDIPMLIRPLRGANVYVNGKLVSENGVALHPGDVINLHDLEAPLLYQVKAIHPFSLDI